MPREIYFPALVQERLLLNNDSLKTAKMVRHRCIQDAHCAYAVLWQPAFKQPISRNDRAS